MRVSSFKFQLFSNFRASCLGALVVILLGLNPSRASAETILFKGGVIHTVSGQTLSPGDVLVADGKIVAVAQFVDSDTARTIWLQGKHVYPGLIALDSSQGLIEIESVRATVDTTELGDYTPDLQSWLAVNPDSEVLPVTRANGVTHFEPVPQGGVVAGVSGLMQMDGWTIEQMAIKKPAALHVYWPSMTLDTGTGGRGRGAGGAAGAAGGRGASLTDQAKEREKRIKELEDFFIEARHYAGARTSTSSAQPDPRWEAMLPVVKGEIPIVVHVTELRQIKAAVNWAKANDFKIAIAGGRDTARVADLLAERKIPVIYEATYDEPGRDYASYDVNFIAPEILRKAGVTVIFSMGPASARTPLEKNLPYDAAQCVAFGYPADEALKGMTLYPAQFMGVVNRLGSIEIGKEGSLFVCDGDILDIRTTVKQVFVAGHEVSLDSRHTRLYEKYRNRPK